jgi:hypothetical protein
LKGSTRLTSTDASGYLGFGDLRVESLQPGDYTLKVTRYNTPGKSIDLLMSTWTDKSAVTFSGEDWAVSGGSTSGGDQSDTTVVNV